MNCTVEGPRDSVSTQETSTIYVCHKQEETTSTAECIHVGKLKTAVDMTVAQHRMVKFAAVVRIRHEQGNKCGTNVEKYVSRQEHLSLCV